MKTASAQLKAHLASGFLTTAKLWKVTRKDEVVLGFTSLDINLTYDGVVYSAESGYVPSDMDQTSELAVDNMDVLGFLDSASITEEDLMAGVYDGALLDILLVNYEDLTMGHMILAGGWEVGELKIGESTFTLEVRSKTQKLQQAFGDLTSPTCRAQLGDDKCKIIIESDLVIRNTAYALEDDIRVDHGAGDYAGRYYVCTTAGTTAGAQPAYTTVVGNTTTDGTAVFTCFDAWTRYGTVATVASNKAFTITFDNEDARDVDNWYRYGHLVWLTGNNAGFDTDVIAWTASTNTATLFLAMIKDIQVGDTFYLSPGCNKHLEICRDTFDNIINMRAEPYIPGNAAVLDYGQR